MSNCFGCGGPPSSSNITITHNHENHEHLDLLNEEFECYMRVARSLMNTLRRPRDVDVCAELMKKCAQLNASKNMEVKKYTNEFFQYFLKVLNWTSIHQPCPIYKNWYKQSSASNGSNGTTGWVEEKKSYISTKTLADGTILIYMANSTAVDYGWQEEGLKCLKEHTEL